MTEHAAITGVLTNIKHMKTNGEMKLEITIVKEMANEVFRKIGGFPSPEKSRWVALAVMEEAQ